MCSICVMWQMNQLTRAEVKGAIREMIELPDTDLDHMLEILDEIEETEDGA